MRRTVWRIGERRMVKERGRGAGCLDDGGGRMIEGEEERKGSK